MSGSNDTLTARQHAAIAAMLSEPTLLQAAKRAHVGEATLRRWMHLPSFVAAYRSARRQVMDQVIGGLQRVAGEAVKTLERNLTCGRPGVEIRAALGVLDCAAKGLQVGDLLDRVEEIERLLLKEEDDVAKTQARQASRPSKDDCD
jgi:hypothetical protein